jgi:hypothetical protein
MSKQILKEFYDGGNEFCRDKRAFEHHDDEKNKKKTIESSNKELDSLKAPNQSLSIEVLIL